MSAEHTKMPQRHSSPKDKPLGRRHPNSHILGAPSFPCSYLLEQPAIIPIEGLRGRQRHPPMVPKPTTHVGRESLGPQAGSGWKERK